MRRLLTTTALLALLTGAAACGSTSDTPSGAAPSAVDTPSTTPALDQAAATAQACAEAVPVSENAAAAFLTNLNAALETALGGSEADAEKALTDLRANLNAWSETLTGLAGQPIDDQVKTALIEGAAEVKKLSDPEDKTPVAQVERTLKGVVENLKKACA